MLTTNQRQGLRAMSGEELLVQAIFGSRSIRSRIDRELDRRATSEVAHAPRRTSAHQTHFAAEAA